MRGLNQLCSLELRMLNGASVGGSNLGKNARYDQIASADCTGKFH